MTGFVSDVRLFRYGPRAIDNVREVFKMERIRSIPWKIGFAVNGQLEGSFTLDQLFGRERGTIQRFVDAHELPLDTASIDSWTEKLRSWTTEEYERYMRT